MRAPLAGLAMMLCLAFAGPATSKEKIKLMYLESDAEVRAAVLINRLEVPLEVHRIGIFRVGKKLYGVVRFGATDPQGAIANKHRIGTATALLCDRIFGELPELVRIDFEGVSFRETKEKKPEVLSSSSIDRNVWKNVSKTALPLERVQMSGTLYFDPRVQLGEPMPVKLAVNKTAKASKSGKAAAKTPSGAAQTRDNKGKREFKKS